MRFPNWPVQRIQSAAPERKSSPVVLYREFPNQGQRVVACCERAARRGVEAGLTVAETKALLETPASRCSAPVIVEDDPEANRAALRELTRHCLCYSPVAGVDDAPPEESLLIDVAGCTHLFGGEEPLAGRVLADLRRRGFRIQLAIADTPGAAWGVAHFAVRSGRFRIVPPGSHPEVLAELPVEALRLDAETADTLRELDVRTIGELQAIPRSTLPSRFGPDVLRRLDQALGRISESMTPVVEDEPLSAQQEFDPPLADRRSLTLAALDLMRRLLEEIAGRGDGALRLQVRLLCERGDHMELSVAVKQPANSVERWRELFDLQFERTALPAAVLSVHVTVTAHASLDCRQPEFFGGDVTEDGRELTRLLERLGNRLGVERVVRPHLLPEEQPECAVRWTPCLTESLDDARDGDPEPAGTRPLRLEPVPVPVEATSVAPDGPPVRLRWREGLHTLPRCWGPERIETGWWRGRHVRRDYYRVETDDGRHLWLFRDDDGSWFLHGVFE